MFENRGEQAEIFFAGFGGGQQLLGDFGEEVERAGGGEIVEHGELRMERFAGIDVHQFAILALKIRHFDVRKPFQAGSKTTFRPPRPACHAAQLSQIARQKADDQIPFLKWPGLQNEGFAHASGH